MENWRYMMHTIKRTTVIILLLMPLQILAQQQEVLSLDTILQRISNSNLLLQSYNLRAESYKHKADASTAWMAPMAGVGTFMTPYPGQQVMEGRDKGAIMFELEQEIPNPAKLKSKKEYIESQGDVENATRGVTLNNFKAEAKNAYFSWLIAQKRIAVLQQNSRIMETMKKIEKLRYPYNQSELGGIYRADAKIEENINMIRMQEGIISRSRALLNGLMNQPGNHAFKIDSAYEVSLAIEPVIDTSSLAGRRLDILKMDKGIKSMQLNITAIKAEAKPDFKIRFGHMSPLSTMMPKAFSVMGMVSIPIAPWSSKMYKSDVKAMQYEIEAMQKERGAMLQESQGMLYGMRADINTMQERINSMEQRIIPSLQKTMDAYFMNYQENKVELPRVIDSWEDVTMMLMNVLDEKLKLFQMIVNYEKELYR